MSEFEKERKEHPSFTDRQIRQIVEDHKRLKAMGVEEGSTVWRYRVQNPAKFDKFRVKDIGSGGVKITVGRVKGTNRWEIQNYIFERDRFKTAEQVRNWLDKYLKAEIRTLLDFKAWNEHRRRMVNAFLQISNVE
jgi:hypothetical protein